MIPYTLTDFVKALRETIETFEDIGGAVSRAHRSFRRLKNRPLAKNISRIAVGKSAARHALSRIVSGQNVKQEIARISEHMRDSAKEVESGINALHGGRDNLREVLGLDNILKIEAIIDGPRGTRFIHGSFDEMVTMSNRPKPNFKAIQGKSPGAN
jgi:hypothetical protein